MACARCSSDNWSQYVASPGSAEEEDEEKEKPDDEVELVSLDELEWEPEDD